jgi:hypothetical protein
MYEKTVENVRDVKLFGSETRVALMHCLDCGVYYVRQYGHLCKWQKENSGQLEVPGLTTREGNPIYVTPNQMDGSAEDDEIDLFILLKKRVEPTLPRFLLERLKEIEEDAEVGLLYLTSREWFLILKIQ